MAQGRFTKVISMIMWIRTRRLSIKNSLPLRDGAGAFGPGGERPLLIHVPIQGYLTYKKTHPYRTLGIGLR